MNERFDDHGVDERRGARDEVHRPTVVRVDQIELPQLAALVDVGHTGRGDLDQRLGEGVAFRTGVIVGSKDLPPGINNDATEFVSPEQLTVAFDAVILAAGAEVPRELPVPGRELNGVHAALEFLIPQNKEVQFGKANPISA